MNGADAAVAEQIVSIQRKEWKYCEKLIEPDVRDEIYNFLKNRAGEELEIGDFIFNRGWHSWKENANELLKKIQENR